ncbi:aldo/keto reductase [Thermodesulfobacteriota bacterium]
MKQPRNDLLNDTFMDMERLVLGTAQLGINYGIANTNGQPDLSTARSIIQEAWGNRIQEFDTAQAYGESEQILGQALQDLGIVDEARIITKLDPTLDHLNKTVLLKALETSLDNLGVKSLFGLMLHKEDLLELWERGLGEILMDVVDSGQVEYLGVSVYSPEKAKQALETEDISIVQLPANIFDSRFIGAGVFQLAENEGKQIYIRSVFLQGLLLMDVNDIPESLQLAVPVLKTFESLAVEAGISKQGLALGYIRQAYPEAKIIFGVETTEQIRKNVECWQCRMSESLPAKIQDVFDNTEEKIINPNMWNNA